MSAYNNPAFRINRGVVIWAHYGQCAFSTCNSPYQEVHHIDQNPENNEITNLIPLCSIHHRLIHMAKVDFSFYPVQLSVHLRFRCETLDYSLENR